MQVNIPIDAETMDKALAASGFATREEMLAHWLREYVKERQPNTAARHKKDFMDLYGRADLVEDYDHKALRESRTD